MAEHIEKQTAIDAINHELLCGSIADACGLETAYDLIRELKPADVRPVARGEWSVAIGYDPKRRCLCSVCLRMNYEPSNFCPNCGADMRGDEDG